VLIALLTPGDLPTLAPRLEWIQSIGAGVEQFQQAGVRRDDVVITNASGLSAPSIAEFVIGRLLQVWKHLRQMDEFQKQHDYVRTYGRTFKGSTIGIVGMGAIGSAVAERARALGCTVLGLRRSHPPGAAPSPEDAAVAHQMYGMSQLHEMLGQCDAVVVAAPATADTHHLIDAPALAATKAGAMVINVARGSLLDEAAMMAALESGHIAAAALDVFETEPLPAESPLWDAPNMYLSAHSSVSTDRYLDDVFDRFIENLERHVAGRPLKNLVDMETLGFD
jgi:phosphoglycerate dehydrogenase-like enzyme